MEHNFRQVRELTDQEKRETERRRDEQIRLAVLTALHWDLAVPRDRIRVAVERGEVILTGHVALAYEKSCAEADAKKTFGVVSVVNRIECKSEL